jgi:lipoprotein NlpI
MIALDPSLDAGHWRLGIAYHFTRQFEASSKQFAKYHAYDGRDRENGLWKFMADANLHGLDYARAQMLEYTAFDREPFPGLYDLFAGRITPEALFTDLENRGVLAGPMVSFFAHYYCGLWYALTGKSESAIENLTKAVQLFSPESSESSGPGYMWEVARLHLESARTGFPTLHLPSTSRP